MPRAGPPRLQASTRLTRAEVAALDERAELEGTDRAEQIRRAVLAYLGRPPDRGAVVAEVRAVVDTALDEWKDKQ